MSNRSRKKCESHQFLAQWGASRHFKCLQKAVRWVYRRTHDDGNLFCRNLYQRLPFSTIKLMCFPRPTSINRCVRRILYVYNRVRLHLEILFQISETLIQFMLQNHINFFSIPNVLFSKTLTRVGLANFFEGFLRCTDCTEKWFSRIFFSRDDGPTIF